MQGIASALTHTQTCTTMDYLVGGVRSATTTHNHRARSTADGCVQGIAKGERRALLSLPLHNALVVTDDALEGVSVFGDGCLRLLQQRNGGAPLPPALLSFVTGAERWDVRMTALLLWFMGKGGAGGGGDSAPGASSSGGDASLWQEYRSSLPHERDVSCLLRCMQGLDGSAVLCSHATLLPLFACPLLSFPLLIHDVWCCLSAHA